MKFIEPYWSAPKNVHAFTTTRQGGVSHSPFDSFNLAEHVGDNKNDVIENRSILSLNCHVPTNIGWLNQTHSKTVIKLPTHPAEADGSFTTQQKQVCVIMTADCLPILICNKQGTEIAALHGGWRSLQKGIIQEGLHYFSSKPEDLLVWLGPAISKEAYEVGDDVKALFLQHENAFMPYKKKWLLDIYQIAKNQFHELGVHLIFETTFRTDKNPDLFYSYRRENRTGRMATLIWLE